MERQAEIARVKAALYARATRDPAEVAEAARARYGRPPEGDEWADFLDFLAIEWVDGEGWTTAGRLAGELPGDVATWPREVRSGLWVVDVAEHERLVLRDVATEETVAVRTDALPRRTVLRARVVPWDGEWVLSGAPDDYGEMGVIARMDLLERWRASGEAALLAGLREDRVAFEEQRRQRAAWVAHFGADLVVWSGPEAMRAELGAFLAKLAPDAGAVVELGPALAGPGRHGAIFDEVEGVHFLPDLGRFLDQISSSDAGDDLIRAWLADPGVTALPFLRAPSSTRLDALGSIDEVRRRKTGGRRARPSLLPGPLPSVSGAAP